MSNGTARQKRLRTTDMEDKIFKKNVIVNLKVLLDPNFYRIDDCQMQNKV